MEDFYTIEFKNKKPDFDFFFQQESSEGKFFYLYQAQGHSLFEMSVASECHYNCTENPITIDLNPGNIRKYLLLPWFNVFLGVSD